MKKFFLAYSWILLTCGVILVSVAFINVFYLSKSENPSFKDIFSLKVLADKADKKEKEDLIVPSPDTMEQVKGIATIVESEDARSLIVAHFLQRHNSPLKPYDHFGEVFVELADKHQFDFRLLPAIAMQESNLCKSIPPGSYNCLGFGVHERGTLAFQSFEENFARAARELKSYYIDIGLDTPEKIMTKYTPSSDGSWAFSVNQWMAEMKYDSREMGREKNQDASVLEYVGDDERK